MTGSSEDLRISLPGVWHIRVAGIVPFSSLACVVHFIAFTFSVDDFLVINSLFYFYLLNCLFDHLFFLCVNHTVEGYCDSRCVFDQSSAQITTHESSCLSIPEPDVSDDLLTTLSTSFPNPCSPHLLGMLLRVHPDPSEPAVGYR